MEFMKCSIHLNLPRPKDIFSLIFRDKQKRLASIRDKLNAQMQQRKDDEDDRIRKAVEESEARQRAEDERKAAITKKMQESITKHRTEVVSKL